MIHEVVFLASGGGTGGGVRAIPFEDIFDGFLTPRKANKAGMKRGKVVLEHRRGVA
jgi:hypothetical protein